MIPRGPSCVFGNVARALDSVYSPQLGHAGLFVRAVSAEMSISEFGFVDRSPRADTMKECTQAANERFGTFPQGIRSGSPLHVSSRSGPCFLPSMQDAVTGRRRLRERRKSLGRVRIAPLAESEPFPKL